MGATIPVMMRVVGQKDKSLISYAYGLNILGAVVGSLATGFLFLEWFGLHSTRLTAVAMNGSAAALLATVVRRWKAPTEDSVAHEVEATTPESWIMPTYCLVGFVALGLEVVWLRFLGITNSNSTITFTLTLAIYLLGMGLGSLAVYPLLNRFVTSRSIFIVANLAVGISSLVTFRMVYFAVYINDWGITQPSIAGELTLWNIGLTEGLIIGGLVFLPTIFMGLVYPAVCEMVTRHGVPPTGWIAKTYFFGTLGSVIGILLTATVMIPTLGLHGALTVLVLLSLLAAGVAGVLSEVRFPGLLNTILAIGVLWGLSISYQPQPVLGHTIAKLEGERWYEYPLNDPDQPISEIVRVRAGSSGTVMIKKTPGKKEHFVHVDDQLVASTNIGARVDSLMLAHLPLLLHPDPKNALTVGFGSGGTSYAMTTHGIETYCVEIEPEVPRCADLLEHQNFNILNQPNFTLILNDARDHLHLGTRKYDVISTDVTNLQYKQNSSLYTVEYFDLMRQQLNPEGIACAWIPMASIDSLELRILLKSFQTVFPHATLWFMNHTHTNFGILIGTPSALQVDFQRVKAGFRDERISENLRLVGMTDPLQFVNCLHLNESGYSQYCGNVVTHTDDQPVLEFSSPLSSYRYYETFRENLSDTLRYRPSDVRPYVVNASEVDDSQWESHEIASACFCQVLLETYDFVIHTTRGERVKVIEDLKRSLEWADRGMAALPDDEARSEFYQKFFLEGEQWLQAHPR